MKCHWATLLLIAVIPTPSFSETIIVPQQVPTIQDAIDSATALDTVLVLAGTYLGAGNVNLTFNGKAITVISADGPDQTIIDAELGGGGLSFTSQEDSTSLFSGFTLCNFRNPAMSLTYGATRCIGSSPRIENCIFRNNRSTSASFPRGVGGAVYIENAAPTIVDCSFIENGAGETQGVGGGGAIYCEDSTPRIMGCSFAQNLIVNIGSGSALLSQNSTLLLENCTFVQNASGYLCSFNGSTPTFNKCIFAFNEGIPVHCEDSLSMPVLSCCDVFGNTSGDWVGCIAAQVSINFNLSADPQFCDAATGDFTISGTSPCAPGNNACNDLIGASTPGCNCCILRGDIDRSGSIDIGDVTFFVGYMFKGGPPPACIEEANVNGDITQDISDLTFLVGFMFKHGAPLEACP